MAQTIQRFVSSRKPHWERLEQFVQLLEKGKAKGLKAEEILDVSRLYRQAADDLARLQAFRGDQTAPDPLEIRLNQLVARAHGQLYRNPSPGWAQVWRYLWDTFPRVFRQTVLYTGLAMVVFVLGGLLGFISTLQDDAFAPLLVPPHLIEMIEEGNVWFDSILSIRPLATSMIMTNNISVSFLAFALGMTFGLGTTYLLAFNGLLLGTLAALCHLHGLDADFWSFVLPHGVIELNAIFMAGGAGYVMAWALLVPGDLPRRDALVRKGRTAIRLVLGCVPLLVVAGIIEGYLSPAHLASSIKFLVAAILLSLLALYVIFTGGKTGGVRDPESLRQAHRIREGLSA